MISNVYSPVDWGTMAHFFFSKASAQEVANAILTARSYPDDYFELIIVQYIGGKEVVQQPLLIKEARAAQKLSSGQEVINCKMKSGRVVTILLPSPKEREIGVAEVLIQGE